MMTDRQTERKERSRDKHTDLPGQCCHTHVEKPGL